MIKSLNSYRVLFVDLDGTLISTFTKETFPKGIWDMSIKWDVWKQIRNCGFEYIFIVTNQGGIGTFVSEEDFELKLDYITASLGSFVSNNGIPLTIDSIYCPSTDTKNPYRKPNTGMLEHVLSAYNIDIDKSEMLMIGDASGKPGQFSDSDLETAENFDIDYLDVDDFLKEI